MIANEHLLSWSLDHRLTVSPGRHIRTALTSFPKWKLGWLLVVFDQKVLRFHKGEKIKVITSKWNSRKERFYLRSTDGCPLVVDGLLLSLLSPGAPLLPSPMKKVLTFQAFINSPSTSCLWPTHLSFAGKLGIFTGHGNHLVLGAMMEGFLFSLLSTSIESSLLLMAHRDLPPHLTLGWWEEKVRVWRRRGQWGPGSLPVCVKVIGHRPP